MDTIAVGGTVTWTWGGGAHGVQSTGTGQPGSSQFTSSPIQSPGTYANRFTVAGTYPYDGAVHGTVMSGVIVVQ